MSEQSPYEKACLEWLKGCTISNHPLGTGDQKECGECTEAFLDYIKDLRRSHLSRLADDLRKIALEVGPMHSWWDIVFDIKAHLDGRRCIVIKSTEQWITEAETLLSKRLS